MFDFRPKATCLCQSVNPSLCIRPVSGCFWLLRVPGLPGDQHPDHAGHLGAEHEECDHVWAPPGPRHHTRVLDLHEPQAQRRFGIMSAELTRSQFI